jgi:hypothetical protein
MHAPLHAVRPVPQPAAHAPLSQTAPHVTPQPPQFVGSFAIGAHAPAQLRSFAAHAQWPCAHCSVAAHDVPQPPQWLALLDGSMHAPEQRARFGLQVAAQRPTSHTGRSPPHACPHSPQLVGSDRRSTHASPQRVSPTRQWVTAASGEALSGAPASSAMTLLPGNSSVTVPHAATKTHAANAQRTVRS